jgi:hypothetical protein
LDVTVSWRGLIVIVIERVPEPAVGTAQSVALTVNVLVPVAVGVPESRPVESRVSPAGSEPDVLDHV